MSARNLREKAVYLQDDLERDIADVTIATGQLTDGEPSMLVTTSGGSPDIAAIAIVQKNYNSVFPNSSLNSPSRLGEGRASIVRVVLGDEASIEFATRIAARVKEMGMDMEVEVIDTTVDDPDLDDLETDDFGDSGDANYLNAPYEIRNSTHWVNLSD